MATDADIKRHMVSGSWRNVGFRFLRATVFATIVFFLYVPFVHRFVLPHLRQPDLMLQLMVAAAPLVGFIAAVEPGRFWGLKMYAFIATALSVGVLVGFRTFEDAESLDWHVVGFVLTTLAPMPIASVVIAYFRRFPRWHEVWM